MQTYSLQDSHTQKRTDWIETWSYYDLCTLTHREKYFMNRDLELVGFISLSHTHKKNCLNTDL